MRYYAFKRIKSTSTLTYGVITINDSSRLPDKEFDGGWRIGKPWEPQDEFDENDAPSWFDLDEAQTAIKQFGYWLVDMQENSKGY